MILSEISAILATKTNMFDKLNLVVATIIEKLVVWDGSFARN